jgi:SAM-dependent methyltransferase
VLKLDPQRIAGLSTFLDDLQYDAVQRSLRPNYFVWPFPPLDKFQQLVQNLPELQRFSYKVLLLGQTVRKKRLERIWGRARVQELLELGLLERDKITRLLRTANFSIVSLFGRYFVVSLNPYYPGSRDPNASIYIGPDSLTLAGHVLGADPVDRGLDLCSGSGIQAILLARKTKQVFAVELHEEAVHTARFNAMLNGVGDKVEVRHGNLYEAAPEGPFDLIVSNPPFIPVPSTVDFAMCANGGEDGLVVLKPLLEGLPSRLADDGRAIIYAEGVGDDKGPFVRQLLRDLAQRARWDIKLVMVSRLSVKGALILRAMSLSKLKGNVPEAPQELAQWRDLYARLEATHLFNYVLHIRKGQGSLALIPAFDPEREQRGFEVEPGLIVKPRN